MQSTGFANKEIVWAKVRGYPWWPAQISKLPTADNNVFKVLFIAEDYHAFLNPKDVKKYSEQYDQYSKKKMKGLGAAIQAADELYKRRLQNPPKLRNSNKGRKALDKTKTIRKKLQKKQEQEAEDSSSSEQESARQNQIDEELDQASGLVARGHSQEMIDRVGSSENLRNNQQVKSKSYPQIAVKSKSYQELGLQIEQEGQESSQVQRWLSDHQQKIDRQKIDRLQQTLQNIIDDIKHKKFRFNREIFQQVVDHNLTGEELLHSKLTNMLNFIVQRMRTQEFPSLSQLLSKEKESIQQQANWLAQVQTNMKQKIFEHLTDTSYYDGCLKLIEKNKRNKSEYENKVIQCLQNGYRIKHELAVMMASKLVAEMANFAAPKERELLEDLKVCFD